jgi:hypothetical protein
MILDRPKRRCETMVGVALVDENEAFHLLNRRLCRAFDEVKKGFQLDVCWGDRITEILDGDKKRLRFSLTITAIVYREPPHHHRHRLPGASRVPVGPGAGHDPGPVRAPNRVGAPRG